MNSFASISFLLLFLIKGVVPSMDLCCELQKLPKLFEHYEEHKTCNDDSFFKFFVNDYLNIDGDSPDHHDEDDHESLPFQGFHQCCHPAVFYASGQYFSLAVFELTPQYKFGYFSFLHTSEILDSPFQPPKS